VWVGAQARSAQNFRLTSSRTVLRTIRRPDFCRKGVLGQMELTEPVHDRIVILPRRAGIHPEANRVDVIVMSWTGLNSHGTQG
jgi:hypothetical protein